MSVYVPPEADLIEADIEAYLEAHARKSLLRFITCGSVDDGKSTLIGRLLHDTSMIFEDQLAALTRDSEKVGTQGKDLDFALLVDGLSAEREQGITIDVAYRFFTTEKRKFIVADTPGHEQYTRNMVTGASTADLAVLLVDARKGILTQTRRHSFLTRLVGVKHLVLAINKMDLVGYSQAVAEAIAADFAAFRRQLDLPDVEVIPMAALKGENIVQRSANMGWYKGPTLLDHLETLPVGDAGERPFRMPVQWVNRPHLDFRGFAGTVSGGQVMPGDRVRVVPGGGVSRVTRIVTADGDLAAAAAGEAVTLTLADEVDCSRGSVICAADDPVAVADQFEATIVWMADEALVPGRSYLLKTGAASCPATVAPPKYAVDVNTLEHLAVKTLGLNGIGVAVVTTQRAIPFAPYGESRELGGFILIDRETNGTVAAGTFSFALRRSQNVHWQAIEVTREAHARALGQKPLVLWFTGLSGAGKSTIANLVEKKLHAMGRATFLLDGDNVRHGLNKDLGFTEADRIENIRRIGEVAKLMTDAGLIVLTAFISPFRAERQMVRNLCAEGEFVEIYVDTPLEDAESRDVKGLYAKARRGELSNFTGIDSPYQPPEAPEIHISTRALSAEAAAEHVVERILERIATAAG